MLFNNIHEVFCKCNYKKLTITHIYGVFTLLLISILFVVNIIHTTSFAPTGTYAFQNMPVGEATVLISMAPVFVAMFSACFLGESISLVL